MADLIRQVLNQIEIPAKWGTVVERLAPAYELNGVIVFVQNLPANVGVQKNISKIIEWLVATYGFELVLAEGASGPAEFSVLDGLPAPVRRRFFLQLMKKGYVTGPEFVIVSNPASPVELWGIDSPKWYRRNWKAVKELYKREADIPLIDGFRKSLLDACSDLVSKDVKTLLDMRERYRQSSGIHTIPGGNRPGPQVAPVSQQTPNAASNRYAYLRTLALYAKVTGALDQCPTPILVKLRDVGVDVGTIGDETEGGLWQLFDPTMENALDDFCFTVLDSLGSTQSDFAHISLFRIVELGRLAFPLDLQPKQAEVFRSIIPEDPTRVISERLSQLNEHLPADQQLVFPKDLKPLFVAAHQYYQSAANRSDKMVTFAVAETKRRGLDRAIAYISGFHSLYFADSVAHIFGYGCVVIMPRIEQLDQGPIYRGRVLTEDVDRNDSQSSGSAENGPQIGKSPLWLNLVSAFHSLFARIREKSRDRLLRRQSVTVINSLGLAGCERVLDVGCSGGILLLEIAKRLTSGKVVGLESFNIDLMPGPPAEPTIAAIDGSGLGGRIGLVNDLIRFPPFVDDAFDAVTCGCLDRIFNAGECRTTLREIVRVLKPRGRIAVLTGRYLKLCQETMRRSGIKDVKVTSLNGLRIGTPYLVFGTKNESLTRREVS